MIRPKSTTKKPTGVTLRAKDDKKARERVTTLVKPEDLLPSSMEKLCLALSYLDAHQLSVAKATDLISVIKQLFDITQVLQGKPTTISANNNRKALKDLIPAVLREAERRGLRVEGQVIEGEVVRVEAPGSEGTRQTPPGGHRPGPIQPRQQSDFSKLVDSL